MIIPFLLTYICESLRESVGMQWGRGTEFCLHRDRSVGIVLSALSHGRDVIIGIIAFALWGHCYRLYRMVALWGYCYRHYRIVALWGYHYRPDIIGKRFRENVIERACRRGNAEYGDEIGHLGFDHGIGHDFRSWYRTWVRIMV